MHSGIIEAINLNIYMLMVRTKIIYKYAYKLSVNVSALHTDTLKERQS